MPVPAPIFCAIVRSPDVVVVSAILPLLVVMPVRPTTASTVRSVAVFLTTKPLPAVATDAAIVPIALAFDRSTAPPASIPRPVTVATPAVWATDPNVAISNLPADTFPSNRTLAAVIVVPPLRYEPAINVPDEIFPSSVESI